MIRDIDDPNQDSDDELSLKPLLQTLWSYRRFLLTVVVAVGVAYVALMVVVYAVSPSERFASIGFQLTFEGAERDQYPNGTKFSSAEIVSTPVLTEVFKANELERYGTYAQFKDSMFVIQGSRELEMLSYEYQAKLADSRLSPVDRSRLEEEFREKRDSLRSAQYTLNIRRREGVMKIPPPILSKVLTDTLSTWATHAAQRRGAVGYDIPILTSNVLRKDFFAADDYIVAVDILRAKVERILKTVDEIAKIPGAAAVRMGQEQIGLADLRAALEDLTTFKIEPLISLIRANGLSRNATRMDQYFEGRRFEVQLARTEAAHRLKALQEALRDYEQRSAPESAVGEGRGQAVTPQVTETFIDKLVQLSTNSVDIEYRQDLTKRIIEAGITVAELTRQADYYESMRQSFASARAGTNPPLEADVSRRTNEAFDEMVRVMNQVQGIYAMIVQQNLNPSTVLFLVTSPFAVRTTSGLSLRTVALYFFIALFVAAIVAAMAALAHAYFRHWISPRAARPPQSGVPPSAGAGQSVGV